MMRTGLIACFLLSGCSLAEGQQGTSLDKVSISNFKLGYVCPANPSDPEYTESTRQTSGIADGSICRETDSIIVTDEQKCVFSGVSYPCTWYGYEFDYENMPENVSLNCVALSNLPGNSGNPKGIISENSKRTEFQLDLEAGTGRFYNPLYVIALEPGQSAKDRVFATTCNLSQQEVFSYKVEIVFPESPENPLP